MKNVEIDGPDAATVTISGGLKSGVFFVPRVIGPITVSIDDLTVTEGIGVKEQYFPRAGGGFLNGYGQVTLTRVAFIGNVINDGSNGGAIHNRYGTMTFNSCVISNNSVRDGYAGGIRNEQWGTMTLTDTVVSGNKSQYYAGISTQGHMTIVRGTIMGNVAEEHAGGINMGGILTVIDSTISGNVAPDGGAGIYNVRGVLTIHNTTIADNQGDGVTTNGWTDVVDSTIARNYGDQAGGFYVYGGTLRVTNSTISGNVSEKMGGAIRIVEFVNPPDPPDAVVELTACTITDNLAKGTGGGGGIEIIATPDGSARVLRRSCIVSGNRSKGTGDDVHGSVISLGYNFIGNGDGSLGWVAKDKVGTPADPLNPQLAPLADYGGKTWTHALPSGSPAIKKGDPALKGTYDQRGTERISTFIPDVGAFQTSDLMTKLQVIAPEQVIKGQLFSLKLIVIDPWGNHAVLNKQTVSFTSTDLAAQLPADYTFTAADLGSHEFSVTLNTVGTQQITAAEGPDGLPFGTATINVEDGGRWSALGTMVDADGVILTTAQRRLRRR